VLVAVLVLIGLGLPVLPARAADGGLRWSAEPTAATAAPRDECADVMFLAARGSLEEGPYGTMIEQWRDELAAATASVPGRGVGTVREVYVDYPAVGPDTMLDAGLDQLFFAPQLPTVAYLDSVATGVEHAEQALADSAHRCPEERWVLVGFSQGAQVITEVLAHRGAEQSGQLLLAMLMGNPTHYPGQAVTEGAGNASEQATGLAAALHYIRHAAAAGREEGGEGHAKAAGVRAVLELGQGRTDGEAMARAARDSGFAVPPALASRVMSLCNEGDPVCDSGPLIRSAIIDGNDTQAMVDENWDVHHRYLPDQESQVLARVSAELRALVPSPEVTVPAPGPPLTAGGVLAGVAIASLLTGLGVALYQLSRRRTRTN